MVFVQGTVKWFNSEKGFGFITPDEAPKDVGESRDVFVHYKSIEGTGYRELFENQRVRFTITLSPKGPQAEQVTPLPPAQDAPARAVTPSVLGDRIR